LHGIFTKKAGRNKKSFVILDKAGRTYIKFCKNINEKQKDILTWQRKAVIIKVCINLEKGIKTPYPANMCLV